jgi:hypothetical protein
LPSNRLAPSRLALENIALRQQIVVLKRNVTRPRINDSDRTFWILMRRLLRDWKNAIFIVNPATVVRWHRQGIRYYWRRKSRAKPGRPPIDLAVIHLIRRLSRENPLWGAPRIQSELALLGHTVADSTVAKYMIRPENAALAGLAYVPREPHAGERCLRLLPGPNVGVQAALMLRGTVSWPPPDSACQRNESPNRPLDRATDRRSFPWR